MLKKTLLFLTVILLHPLYQSFSQSNYTLYKESIFDSTPGGRVVINVNYPLMKNNYDNIKQQKFNQYISEIIKKEIDNFKNMIDTNFLLYPEMRYDFSIGYSVLFQENYFVSILFNTYAYTGGAHGIPYVFNINYDLNTDEDVSLLDVFKGNFLDIFSNYSRSYLIEQGLEDDEWLREGTSSDKLENFSAWGLNGKEIIVTFQAYQVGPYVIGMPQVLIPLDKFKGYIRSDGVLKKFVN